MEKKYFIIGANSDIAIEYIKKLNEKCTVIALFYGDKTKLENNGVKLYVAETNISDDVSGILIESVIEGFIEYLSENKTNLEEILKQQEANLNNEQ